VRRCWSVPSVLASRRHRKQERSPACMVVRVSTDVALRAGSLATPCRYGGRDGAAIDSSPQSGSGRTHDTATEQVDLRPTVHDSVGEWPGLRGEECREWRLRWFSLDWRCEPIHGAHHIAGGGDTELLLVCPREPAIPRPS